MLLTLQLLCAALTLATVHPRTPEGAARAGNFRRGNRSMERSHDTNAPGNDQGQRREEEVNYNYNAENNEADNNYRYDNGNAWEVEYTPYDYDEHANSTLDNFVTTVQNYAANAESTMWSFYENPPSDWTRTQWDVVFFLALGTVATCSLGAACCAYSCVGKNSSDTDTARRSKPRRRERYLRRLRRGKKGRAGKKQGDEIAEDCYEQYREGEEEDTAVSDDDISSVSGHEASTLTESCASGHEVSAGYAPPSPQSPSSLADYTLVQREKEARNWAVWRALEEEKDREVREAREEEKEDIGDEVTTRHCNRRGSRGGRTLQSVAELDAALEKAEDRLLEARDRQHNFVGYYL